MLRYGVFFVKIVGIRHIDIQWGRWDNLGRVYPWL